MWRRTFLKLKTFVQEKVKTVMEAKPGDKRARDGSKKQQVVQEVREDRKRKVALLIAYNGKGYYGLQVNPGFATIESDVLKALLELELVPQDHHDNIQKMSFQRAARTDKGVSAAGNILSLKMRVNEENLLDKINEKLPSQIRVMDCIRTTKHFNAKNNCMGRTYVYLLPTYAFAPVEETVTLEYRTNYDIVEKVNEVLEKFKGTHNFHNFTSGILPTDGRSKRYIKEFECRLPFVKDGVEFCVLSVTGQSFMMHQIRKMVGLTIAIVKGYANIAAIEKSWQHEKMDIPKAPGLGLVLEKLHYEEYNRRFCQDGSHVSIDFSKAELKEKLDKFKDEYIFSDIIKTEIEEQSMMDWLSRLHMHTCLPAQSQPDFPAGDTTQPEEIGNAAGEGEKSGQDSENGTEISDKKCSDEGSSKADNQSKANANSETSQGNVTSDNTSSDHVTESSATELTNKSVAADQVT